MTNMRHLRTFEQFSTVDQIDEGALSFLGISTEKDRMKKILPANLKKYIFDVTKGRVKNSNPNPEASESDWEYVSDKLIASNFKIDKMGVSDVEKKMAKYLLTRAENSVSATASGPHNFGSSPTIGQ